MLYHFNTLCGGSKRLCQDPELAIYLLTPGFTRGYHKNVFKVSDTTITKYLAWSRELAIADPLIADLVSDNAASITAEDSLKMARMRGRAQLTWWSRLAIAEFAYRLGDTGEAARLFSCSRRTVQLVLKGWQTGYDPISGERRLSRTQASPPGMWRSRQCELTS